MCWGNNGDGQTGLGNDTPSSVSTAVTVPGVSAATRLALSEDTSCALIAGGTIQCWGSNFDGEVGSGSVNSEELTPQTVLNISTATAISADADSVCALLQEKTVRCWGENDKGQANNGDRAFLNQRAPQMAQYLQDVTEIGLGEDMRLIQTLYKIIAN